MRAYKACENERTCPATHTCLSVSPGTSEKAGSAPMPREMQPPAGLMPQGGAGLMPQGGAGLGLNGRVGGGWQ